jgi:hypothetical protein
MYSRAEASQIKHSFWTTFGRYMAVHPNSEGAEINWVNYHTGYKHVYFRMDADQTKASISIELHHPDELLRELFYEKLESFKSMLHDILAEEWSWKRETRDEYGKIISVISSEIQQVNVYDRDSWPQIISFLKPRIMALDEFWNNVKDAFEELR